MAGYDNIPEIESLLNCPICLEAFVYPKRLNCDHTFCQECLEQHIPPGALIITCPTCRSKTKKPAGGISQLPHDFRVGQFRDGLQAIAQMTASGKLGMKCGLCQKKGARVSCLDCHKYMCDNCLKNHNVRQALSLHTVIQIGDLKKCLDHGEHCSHVCVECEKLICVTCTQDECAEHNVCDIGDSARRHVGAGVVRDVMTRTRTEYNKMTSARIQKFTVAEEKIRENTAKLCKQLKEQEACLIRELHEARDSSMGEIAAMRRQEEEKLVLVEQCGLRSADDIKMGVPRAILDALPILEGLKLKKQTVAEVSFTPTETVSLGELSTSAKDVKRVFRFEKVVLVQRDDVTTLLAKHGDIIVRNDFRGTQENHIKVYRKDIDREYAMDEKHVAKLPIIFKQNWKPYLPNIRQMTYKIKAYAQANNIQLCEMVVKVPADNKSRERSRGRRPSGGRPGKYNWISIMFNPSLKTESYHVIHYLVSGGSAPMTT